VARLNSDVRLGATLFGSTNWGCDDSRCFESIAPLQVLT
jgi:hypothetical protein